MKRIYVKSRLASKPKEQRAEIDNAHELLRGVEVLDLIDDAKAELAALTENIKAIGIDLEIIDSRAHIGIFSYEPYANYISRYIQSIDDNSIRLKELLLNIKHSIDIAVEKLNRNLQNM